MNVLQSLLPMPKSDRSITAVLPLSLLALSVLMAGCSSTSTKSSGNGSSSIVEASDRAVAQAAADTQRIIRDLDTKYVIGPTAAGEMDYRIDWQFEGASKSPLKAMGVRGDAVFTLDTQNFLTHLRLSDGHLVWRIQAADAVADVIGLNVIGDRACLFTGSDTLIFDAISSAQLDRWSLEKIAGTQAVEHGQHFIYGARSGEVTWISNQMGFMWRAYQVARSIAVQPVIRDSVLAVVGLGQSGAVVMVLNADTATQYWSKTLLEQVVCKPVIGDGLLYVAGRDQYLWAYDLATGRTQWSVLTTAPLTSSPTLVGDRLYQQIPGAGLTCFNAAPVDRPGGEQFWQNHRVAGSVIMERRGDLFVWDAATKTLQIVEANRGGIKKTIDLPQVEYFVVGGESGNEIFGASKDGRVVHLSPRN
jgi:outer membrane protein assembly factor BamB